MKHRSFLGILFFMLALFVFSGAEIPPPNLGCDIITLQSGREVLAESIKINQDSTEIDYKKCGFREGPTYSIEMKEVKMIQYNNGNPTFIPKNPTKSHHVQTPIVNKNWRKSLILFGLYLLFTIIGVILIVSWASVLSVLIGVFLVVIALFLFLASIIFSIAAL